MKGVLLNVNNLNKFSENEKQITTFHDITRPGLDRQVLELKIYAD